MPQSEQQPQFKGPCIHCRYPVYLKDGELVSEGPDDCNHEIPEEEEQDWRERLPY